MSDEKSLLRAKHILAVDDEPDVLDTIRDILDESAVEVARDYDAASEKIATGKWDLVILDIMGVSGLKLLEEAVDRKIPAVMLTAFAVNPETLVESIKKGAVSFLPKESLAVLDVELNAILKAISRNEPTWELLLKNMWGYFNKRWGPGWQEKDRAFWEEFCRAYSIGKETQARLLS